MNITEVKVDWSKRKAELKGELARLTDNDLMFEKEEKEVLFRKLQMRLGKTREELLQIIAAL